MVTCVNIFRMLEALKSTFSGSNLLTGFLTTATIAGCGEEVPRPDLDLHRNRAVSVAQAEPGLVGDSKASNQASPSPVLKIIDKPTESEIDKDVKLYLESISNDVIKKNNNEDSVSINDMRKIIETDLRDLLKELKKEAAKTNASDLVHEQIETAERLIVEIEENPDFDIYSLARRALGFPAEVRPGNTFKGLITKEEFLNKFNEESSRVLKEGSGLTNYEKQELRRIFGEIKKELEASHDHDIISRGEELTELFRQASKLPETRPKLGNDGCEFRWAEEAGSFYLQALPPIPPEYRVKPEPVQPEVKPQKPDWTKPVAAIDDASIFSGFQQA